jgi:hypothetical protein
VQEGSPSLIANRLKRTRDEWVRGAYEPDTKEFLARVNLAS